MVIIIGMTIHVAALPRLAFRLDDVQCGWMMNNAFRIMDLFIEFNVPLTVGVITGAGDCYSEGLAKRVEVLGPHLLEVASHTVQHKALTEFSYVDQLAEVGNSRRTLQTLLNLTDPWPKLFLPPDSKWSNDSINALVASGYTHISGQCTVVQMKYSGVPDNMCPPNMYPGVSPIFWSSINGITHVPVGSSIANFVDETALLDISTLFDGADSVCFSNSWCSVNSAVTALSALTVDDTQWAVVLMHPQNFGDGEFSTMKAYYTSLLTYAKQRYDLRTISDIPVVDYSPPAWNYSEYSQFINAAPPAHAVTHLHALIITLITFLLLFHSL
jgi:peptidoglycan/xylan/chitin deacetylase (PgdA/CDA1 family)